MIPITRIDLIIARLIRQGIQNGADTLAATAAASTIQNIRLKTSTLAYITSNRESPS